MKNLADKIEGYGFDCEAGPLAMCVDWRAYRERASALSAEVERMRAAVNKFLKGRMQHFHDSRTVDDDLVELASALDGDAA